MTTKTKTNTPPAKEARKSVTRCSVAAMKEGDVASRHSFLRIVGFQDEVGMAMPPRLATNVVVQNEEGRSWVISKEIVENELSTANQSSVEHVMNRTALIEVMMSHPRQAMTVTFRKKVDAKAVAKALHTYIEDPKAWEVKVEEALAGEQKTMVGYHEGSLDPHGRLRFIEATDPLNPNTGGFKLVDPRTVERLVVDLNTYMVKE